MKECSTCRGPFPATTDFFYRKNNTKDGLSYDCKTCASAYGKKWYRDNKTRKDAQNAQWAKNNGEYLTHYHRQWHQKHVEIRTERSRGWWKNHPEQRRLREANYRHSNPQKVSAHQAVWYALKKGKIIKPTNCEQCGRAVKIHGHHHDYVKKLEVVWLCGKCHRSIHEQAE